MNPGLRVFIVSVTAVAIPSLCLILQNPVERQAVGLDVAPFGTRVIFFVHMLLSLPLAWILVFQVRSSPSVRVIGPGAWVVVALMSVGVTSLLTPALPTVSMEFGVTGALILRSGLGLLFVWPWCFLVRFQEPAETVSSKWQILAALALSVIPPGVYADSVLNTQRQLLLDHLGRQRHVKALGSAQLLKELGDSTPIGKQSIRKVHDELLMTISQQENRLRFPLAENASDGQCLHRALILISLNRLEEAAALLQPRIASNDIALMLMGSIEQERENWSMSDTAFEKVLAEGPKGRAYETDALEGLIFNARSSRRPNDVEHWLKYGMKHYATRRGHYAFQYAQHFSHLGQPQRAIQWYQEAISADDQLETKANEEILHLRLTTPACLLSRGN